MDTGIAMACALAHGIYLTITATQKILECYVLSS